MGSSVRVRSLYIMQRHHRFLGFKWEPDMLTSIESSDSVNLIVFTQGRHVTCWFEHPRNQGDFAPVASLMGYTRDRGAI